LGEIWGLAKEKYGSKDLPVSFRKVVSMESCPKSFAKGSD